MLLKFLLVKFYYLDNMLFYLNRYEKWIYQLVFSNYSVDQDTISSSLFLQNTNYSGLENFIHVNIVFKCLYKSKKPIKYLDKRNGKRNFKYA